ncbi:hypothetical protein ACHWQZ_G006639 [Mnemiopsis leidyi]
MLGRRVCTRVYGTTIHRTVFGGSKTKDPYKVLGVNRNATDAEVKEAYLKKCKELHPDVNSGPKAAMQFMEVKDAYHAIGKAENRRGHQTADDITKRSGLEDAINRVMGDKKDWMPDFEKSRYASEESFLHRHQQRKGMSFEDFEMGRKADTSTFQDWEKEHFDNLSRSRAYEKFGVPRGNIKEGEEKAAAKRHIAFAAVITFSLLFVNFMDVF